MSINTTTRGASSLEFTLLGLPLLFVLIGTVEMCRGMWLYHTLAYAIKEGSRYTSVHGQSCTIPPNACTVSISQISRVIQTAGSGLATDSLTLTFTPFSGTATTCLLKDCVSNYATGSWPSATANGPGESFRISGVYPFQSAMLMFWPGQRFITSAPAVVNFSASAMETMQY